MIHGNGMECALRLWVCFQAASESLSKPAIERTLTGAGLQPAGWSGQRAGPGLLFFDTASRELCGLLREISCDGLERVLAIATSRERFDGRSAWPLLAAGASDVFAWDHFADPASQIAARLRRWEAVDALAASPQVGEMFVGRSPVWTRLVRRVVEVARFTEDSVLICGESGTGKELVAQLIHALDQRTNKGELVVLDCTTVVPTLSGSEFFGHEKGAFTGAAASREGVFALADGGTLFLDEIGELPLLLQAELLRVIQEGTYKRVGSNVWRKTSFRLVCATNRNLRVEADEGRFRKDLYFRIAAWNCHLPPLRERIDDVPVLVRHFLTKCRKDQPAPELDDAVMDLLLAKNYPGNVRELRQLIARIGSRHTGPGPITVGDVPSEERPQADVFPTAWSEDLFERPVRQGLSRGLTLRELVKIVGDTAIRLALSEERTVRRAAQRLGITDRALQLRRSNRRTEGSHERLDDTSDDILVS
jgi:transcriptional regulator with GAF, ATPase, and Fis domain